MNKAKLKTEDKTITVIAAAYGAREGAIDVTNIMQSKIDAGKTDFKVSKSEFDDKDPSRGNSKHFGMIYEQNNRQRAVACAEGQSFEICDLNGKNSEPAEDRVSPDAEDRIVILGAAYGAREGAKNVTASVRDMMKKDDNIIKAVTKELTDKDPASRHGKHLGILYQYNGAVGAAACKEGQTVVLNKIQENKDRWMTDSDCWEKIKMKKLCDLTMVGTHNSLMNSGPKEIPIDHWYTQNDTICEQFDKGIRYFDIRLCSHLGSYYGYHGVKTFFPMIGQLEELGKKIKDLHSKITYKDIIILELHKMKVDDCDKLAKDIINCFTDSKIVLSNDKLSPESKIEDIIEKGNVILLWDEENISAFYKKYFWKREDNLINNYLGKSSVGETFKEMEEIFKKENDELKDNYKVDGKFWVSQFVDQTDVGSITAFETLFAAAKKYNHELYVHYKDKWKKSDYGLNVLLVDFYGYKNDGEAVMDEIITYYKTGK